MQRSEQKEDTKEKDRRKEKSEMEDKDKGKIEGRKDVSLIFVRTLRVHVPINKLSSWDPPGTSRIMTNWGIFSFTALEIKRALNCHTHPPRPHSSFSLSVWIQQDFLLLLLLFWDTSFVSSVSIYLKGCKTFFKRRFKWLTLKLDPKRTINCQILSAPTSTIKPTIIHHY